MKEKVPWKSVYYACMILSLIVLGSWVFVDMCIKTERSSREADMKWPKLSLEQMYREEQRLKPIVERGATDCEQYFAVLTQLNSLMGSERRVRRERMVLDPRFPIMDEVITQFSLYSSWTDQAKLDRLIQKFGYKEFHRISEKYAPPRAPLMSWKQSFWWIVSGLYWVIVFQSVGSVFTFGHFVIRIRERGQSFFDEVANNGHRMAFAILVWERGLCQYRITNPAEHIFQAARLALQFAVLVMATCLSVFSATAKLARASEDKEGKDAQGNVLVQKAHYAFYTTIWSSYDGSLAAARFHKGTVQQTGVTVKLPSGLWFDVWNSNPLGRQTPQTLNYGYELDYTLGYAGVFKPRQVRWLKLQYNFSGAYLDVDHLFKMPRGDVLNFGAFVGRQLAVSECQSVTPYIWIQHSMPAKGKDPINGTFTLLGLRQTRILAKRLSVSTDIYANHDSGAFGFKSAWLAVFSGNFNWQASKHLTITLPKIQTSKPITSPDDGRKFLFRIGVGLGYAW